MASVSVVEATHPERLTEASVDLRTRIAQLDAIVIAEHRAVADLRMGWQGSAAAAALAKVGALMAAQLSLRSRMIQLATVLADGGQRLGATRGAIISVVDGLRSQGWQVADDGTVTPPAFASAVMTALATGFTLVLKRLLANFAAIDSGTAAALRAACTGALPPPGTSARDVNTWWDDLPELDRRAMLDAYPEQLGNLDGVPVADRSTANELVLSHDVDRVETAAREAGVSVDEASADPERYGLTATDLTRYANARRTRRGLGYNGVIGRGGTPTNDVYLLVYEPERFGGQGRAAIAIGNPDEADDTAVLVPGAGNSVRDGYLSCPDGLAVYRETVAAAGETTKTSVVLWMGYDAPDGLTDVRVAETALARQGGELLADDVNALAVTNDEDSHVTVIGHSYGATTVADAAAASGMRADDVVLVGAPGTDLATSAADFHLDSGGHLYVGAASSDPVTHLGGHVPFTLAHNGISVGLGADPAVDGFGSTRFKAEVPGFDPRFWDDHSRYFARGGESLFSVADVASGNGDMLDDHDMTARHRGEFVFGDSFDPETFRPATGGHYH